MSYTVEYNPELRKNYPAHNTKMKKKPINFLLFAMAFFVIVYALNAFGIMKLLLPGDAAVTTGAFSGMVEQVRSGQSVSEAIFFFFKNVITGGML